MTTGPQQVNNGTAAGELRQQYARARPHAGDFQGAPNKLLEADDCSFTNPHNEAPSCVNQ